MYICKYRLRRLTCVCVYVSPDLKVCADPAEDVVHTVSWQQRDKYILWRERTVTNVRVKTFVFCCCCCRQCETLFLWIRAKQQLHQLLATKVLRTSNPEKINKRLAKCLAAWPYLIQKTPSFYIYLFIFISYYAYLMCNNFQECLVYGEFLSCIGCPL